MSNETIKLVTNASVATLLAGLMGAILFFNHKEKMRAMEDKEGIYRELLQRQTQSLERIADIYSGDG